MGSGRVSNSAGVCCGFVSRLWSRVVRVSWRSLETETRAKKRCANEQVRHVSHHM
jgi:hypothetical protein